MRWQSRQGPGLDLEQLQEAHGVARGGHDAELAVWRGEHDPGCLHVEHLDTAVGEQGEEVDDVEIVDQRVGQLDERSGEH